MPDWNYRHQVVIQPFCGAKIIGLRQVCCDKHGRFIWMNPNNIISRMDNEDETLQQALTQMLYDAMTYPAKSEQEINCEIDAHWALRKRLALPLRRLAVWLRGIARKIEGN